MSKSRDIADSAATINFIDNLTSDAQTQLNTLDTAVDNISVTSGTLTKTFAQDEVATITLSSSITTPVVSVTKEVNQTGVTNNTWDVNSTTENYTRLDSAPATTLDFDADLANGSYAQNFSVTTQETVPKSLKFNNDGTKLFVLGTTGDDVNEYTLSTAYDISTMSFVDSFSVASQSTEPVGLEFNSDGTKMYVLDQNNRNIFQYSLTAFDVSTASYDSVSFSVGTQETTPSDIVFNNDGTKIFVSGLAGDDINEYTLSTAYDISTMSFVDSFSVTSQSIFSPQSVAFNSDGTKMYVLSNDTPDTVFQYSLTAFDVSTASYDSISFAINTNSDNAQGITFSPDGTKMYIADDGANTIDQYTIPKKVTLGSGSFASADVGKTIEANSGVFVLTSTAGAYSETTAPTSYAQVASGSWEMYGVVYNTTDGDLELSGIANANPYDVANAIYSNNSFDVSGQLPNIRGLTLSNDGTKMYASGETNDTIYQYTLSTAYNVSTASYDSKSFSFAVYDSNPQDIVIANNGTSLYVAGENGSDIHELTLSTAYDLSTASHTRNIDISGVISGPKGLAIKPDGTKLYATNANSVREWTMSTAFNISTMSYTGNSLSVNSQETFVRSIKFSSDGTKLFVTGDQEKIFIYNLSTAWDLSTASYSSTFFDLSTQIPNTATSMDFAKDGARLYVSSNASDKVFEYTLETPYIPSGYHAVHTKTSTDTTYWTDINSMTADEAAGDGSIFYCVSTDDRSTWKIAHNTDGIRSIVRNNSGTWQYNSNGTYASTTWTNATTNTELNALQEAMTGASGLVNAYDMSTASYSQTFSVSSQESDPCGIAFNSDGTKMFITGIQGDDVNEYTLSTGFDVSTASYSQNFSVASQATQPRDVVFNSDGTRMFIVSDTTGVRFVYQYNLTTGFDVSTASYSGYSYNVGSQDVSPQAIAFNNDGTNFFFLGNSGQNVYKYTLSTGFDLNSTITLVQSFSVTNEEGNPKGLTFNNDGTKMFIVGTIGVDVNEYNLTTAFDLSTATASQTFSVSSQETNPSGIVFNNDGSKMYITGLAGQDVNEYTVGSTSYPNQMNKTQLDAVSDANHFTLANDLDLGIIFNLSSGTTVPSSDGVSINYDANVLNKGAILGTDYDFDAPAATKVRITALAANNLKVRVV